MNSTKNLSDYKQAITERYVPARTVEESTHRLSTEEICAAINKINPGVDISASEVYDLMKSAGFRFVAVPGTIGLQFKWILIEK